VAGYKVFILVIWLIVPVVGSYLIRADYEEYHAASKIQRADCEARATALRRYTSLLASSSVRIETIEDAETRVAWQRQWNELTREIESVASGLRTSVPQYYPQTDEQLMWMEQWLREQQEAIEDAARERDAYNKAGGGVMELAREADRARNNAEYYRSIGHRGLYDLFMDDANRLEKEHRRRLRERQRLSRAVESMQAEAEQLRVGILSGLAKLETSLKADEQRSYRMELSQRFREFNLLGELIALLKG